MFQFSSEIGVPFAHGKFTLTRMGLFCSRVPVNEQVFCPEEEDQGSMNTVEFDDAASEDDGMRNVLS